MNCWIGVDHQGDRRIVRLAGDFALAQVPDLLSACAPGEGSIELDLCDLVCADASGIDALQRLRAQGATLVNVPGYIQLKLDGRTDASG